MASWRRWLAYQIVAGHGLGMFVLFATPLQLFLLFLSEDHLWAALLTGGLMVVGFAGTLWFAPLRMAVVPYPVRRGTAQWGLLRRFRALVGNGDAIQAVARRVDPGWQDPYTGRSVQETARWLASMELMHWATLVGSVAPVAAAFHYGFQGNSRVQKFTRDGKFAGKFGELGNEPSQFGGGQPSEVHKPDRGVSPIVCR